MTVTRPPTPLLILQIAASAKTVAVLGIKTEAQAGQPAFFVAEYLQSLGVHVIPVPGRCSVVSGCRWVQLWSGTD